MFLRRSAEPRGTDTDDPSLRDRVTGAGRAARAVLFVLLALLALTLAAPGTASADFACSFTGDDSYELDSPGANGESIFPAVNQWEDKAQRAKNLNDTTGMVTGAVNMPRGADQYTMYELNAMRGMNWSGTQRDIGDASQTDSTWDASGADDCEIMDYVNNGIANLIFDGTKILTRISISIKEFASNPSPLSGLYTGRDNVVETLKTKVFVPAVPVMISLTGFWVFSKWRKGQMREAWSGIGWAALTTVAVVTLLTGGNFHKVIDQADSGIASANSYLSEAVLSGMADQMQAPCDLPTGTNVPNRGVRESSCAMYDTLAFRPWALGQFGEGGTNCIFKVKGGGKVDNGTCRPASAATTCDYGKGARCEDLRVRQMVTQSMTNIDVANDVSEEKKYKEDWYGVRQDMAGGKGANHDKDDPKNRIYPVAFGEWAGHSAGNRIGIAFYSLVAALIVGIMVIVLSALTLLWHAVTLIMIIMLPLIATIGIHPSQQKLLKGWLQTFIHSFVLRAGFGVILTVLLVLYQMILPAKISLGMQLLMLVLVSVAVVMMLKKLLSGAYSPQIAGAEDALGVGDMANTVGGKLGQYAPGAAAGVAKTTGRVVGGTAKVGKKGTLAALRTYDNKKNEGRWQKEGKLSTSPPSKREQRKTEYQTAAVQKDQLAEQYAAVEAKRERQAAEAEQAQSSGRLVGGGTPSAYVARPQPAPPLPAPASTPAVPAQQDPQNRVRVNKPDNGPVRQQPRVPAPDPGPVRQQPPTPVPDPRTPPPQATPRSPREGGNGRVSE
ncbi:hypothetical protein ABT213_25165 [Streptomyces sp. NPDC001674]|uniref:hypothetical protein n=1 Tax=Streptomyces sp. NPDC001674 TaxID=3154394 RepID=UPI0033304003